VLCELLRCVSGKLDHLSCPWQQQTVDRAAGCRQATSGNADLGMCMNVVSRCCRGDFPEPPVGAVYRNEGESVRLWDVDVSGYAAGAR
jgi:hypothetical protein